MRRSTRSAAVRPKRLRRLWPIPWSEQFWPDVIARARETNRVGSCLAQSRHIWEGRWAAQYAGDSAEPHLLRCPPFIVLPPTCLRICHGCGTFTMPHSLSIAGPIMSAAMPIRCPNWRPTMDGLSALLGLASRKSRSSAAVRARLRGDRVVLADRAGWEQPLELSAEGDLDRAVAQLTDLAGRGVRLRNASVDHDDVGPRPIGRSIYPRHRRREIRPDDRRVDRTLFRLTADGVYGRIGDVACRSSMQAGAASKPAGCDQTLRELTYPSGAVH